MSERYPHLFSPLDLGAFEVPNRILMGSMHLGWEEHRKGASYLARFYAERAQGGVGRALKTALMVCQTGTRTTATAKGGRQLA